MRVLWAGVAAAVVLTSVSACASTTNGKPVNPQTDAASSGAPTDSNPPTATDSTSSTGGALSEAAAQAALLTAAEVGGGFTKGEFSRNDNPLPCADASAPSFTKQTSPQVDVGAEYDLSSPQAALEEEIFAYADAATATAALGVGQAGMDCTSGTIHYSDGTTGKISISKPQDVAGELAVDAGYAWSVENSEFKGSQVALVIGSVLVTLTFSAAADADTSELPDGLTVTKAAVSKVKSA